MTRVASGQRKRAYRPKTRTGCHTLRRVKCDEARPSCYLCTSTGRKCDGYEPNIEAPPDLSSVLLVAVNPFPFAEFLGNDKERQSFYFFRQYTAPQLSGFLGSDLWEQLLLQAALHEPSIRHAVLALGSLHDKFAQDSGLIVRVHTNRWIDEFVSKNYSQAINILVKPLMKKGQQAIDVCLICSILFASLETMQSSFGSAITHVQSGMKILGEVKYNKETGRRQHDMLGISEIPYASVEMLEEMFARLDFRVTQMVSSHRLEMYESIGAYAQNREIPAIFSGLSKVQELLVSHWHVASYSKSNTWDPPSEKIAAIPEAGAWQRKSISILARWSSAYDAYLNIQGNNLTDKKRKGTAALYILKELGSTAMMLSQTVVDDQKSWDVFCPMFEKIVSLADDIVKADLKSTIERHSYCIDMTLVKPLFEVSCRCRDPTIRKRAISILQTCGRTEGVWNAFLTSIAAQRVQNIEEAGLHNVSSCDNVPDWARISNVSLDFDLTQQKMTLTYHCLENKHGIKRQIMIEHSFNSTTSY